MWPNGRRSLQDDDAEGKDEEAFWQDEEECGWYNAMGRRCSPPMKPASGTRKIQGRDTRPSDRESGFNKEV
jgi:hypothetical protein